MVDVGGPRDLAGEANERLAPANRRRLLETQIMAVTLFVLSEIQLISDGRSGNRPNSVIAKKIRNKKY